MSNAPSSADRRLLLVHAHPDDETITTGATMAYYAAAGAQVTLITCTLGEEGEILVPALAQLEAAQADQLGGYRIAELAAAMRELGVVDHRFLGGAGRLRDSGMMHTPANEKPRAFWRAAADPELFATALAALVEVVVEVRPHVVITYDPDGAYGHPDHIMAHRVTMAAIEQAATHPDGWSVPKVYWTAAPRSVLRAGIEALRAAGDTGFVAVDRVEDFPFGNADDEVTTAIDAGAFSAAKTAALRAHATQITVREPFFALSNHIGQPILGAEYYRLVVGKPGGDVDADGRESDLFGGLDG